MANFLKFCSVYIVIFLFQGADWITITCGEQTGQQTAGESLPTYDQTLLANANQNSNLKTLSQSVLRYSNIAEIPQTENTDETFQKVDR